MSLKHEKDILLPPLFYSLRFRIMVLILFITAVSFIFMIFYIIHQFEKLTQIELEHEGMLLANSLKAGIIPLAIEHDIDGMQQYINRLVELREINDVEINIIVLQGEVSTIVASNIADNIEETSAEEHKNLIASLRYGRPTFFIDKEYNDSELKFSQDSSSPDSYFQGFRFISITDPLIVQHKDFGSINVKISLAFLDKQLKIIYNWTFIILFILMIVLLLTIGFFLDLKIFRPLWNIAVQMHAVGNRDDNIDVPLHSGRDEIGVFSRSFNAMQKRISNLIEAMRGALDNVAHDLKTPLARLCANVEMALKEDRDAISLKETLQDCAEDSEKIVIMLNTLMDISEAETGVMNLEYEEFNVNELVAETIELYDYLAETSEITILADIPEYLYVQADRNRLRQVIANLIDNAIKYTPNGGNITLSGGMQGNEVFIAIEDDGCGIAPDDLPRVFDRLYRAEKSRSQKGLGLGLSMVKAIINAHKGHVEVKSELGHGAKFYLFLPIK